jgi:acyl carrier protein
VDRDKILSIMKAYFAREQPPERLVNFPNIPASTLIEDSTDVMTFVMDLEDELHTEIRLDQVGPKLTNMTFLELADELSLMLSQKR